MLNATSLMSRATMSGANDMTMIDSSRLRAGNSSDTGERDIRLLRLDMIQRWARREERFSMHCKTARSRFLGFRHELTVIKELPLLAFFGAVFLPY